MYYDPMIAKLCTWAPDGGGTPARLAAIDAMGKALDDFEVEGIGHNLPFLSAVMDHPRFREGRLTTAFIAEEYSDGFSGVTPSADVARKLAAIAVFINLRVQTRAALISGAMDNHRRAVGQHWVVTLAGQNFDTAAREEEGNTVVSFSEGIWISVASDWLPGCSHAQFTVDNKTLGVKTGFAASGIRLRHRGVDVVACVRTPRIAELAQLMPEKLPPDTSKMLLCPMPGVITAISVQAGDQVEAGQVLATVEAMKMENVLRAERRATIRRVAAQVGGSLAVDELIMEFE
jgi:propionyl-CoA carboxylase alpha chain